LTQIIKDPGSLSHLGLRAHVWCRCSALLEEEEEEEEEEEPVATDEQQQFVA